MVLEADRLTSLDAGTMIRGRYRLLHGTSAGGQTVRAFDRVRQQTVAVRLLGPTVDPAVRERIRADVARAVTIVDPALAPLFSFDEQGDWALASRAWVDGDPLAGFLARRGPLGPRAVRLLLGCLFDALSALETAGLAHRQITTRNVILVTDSVGTWSEAVLVDAGLSTSARSDAASEGDRAAAGLVIAQAIGLGERFDPRAARIQLPKAGALIQSLERLIEGRPVPFHSLVEARADLLAAIDGWESGKAPPPPPIAAAVPHSQPVAVPTTAKIVDKPAPPASAPDAPVEIAPPVADAEAMDDVVAQPVAVAARREIRITGTPVGASIRWDGREAGTAPLVVADRASGLHVIDVEADGYLSQRLTVTSEGDLSLQFELSPAPPRTAGAPFEVGSVSLSPEELALFFPETAPLRRSWWRRWQTWAIFGAGGAALVVGTYLGATPLQMLGLTTALAAAGAIVAG